MLFKITFGCVHTGVTAKTRAGSGRKRTTVLQHDFNREMSYLLRQSNCVCSASLSIFYTKLFVLFKLYEEIEEIWGCVQLCLAPGE